MCGCEEAQRHFKAIIRRRLVPIAAVQRRHHRADHLSRLQHGRRPEILQRNLLSFSDDRGGDTELHARRRARHAVRVCYVMHARRKRENALKKAREHYTIWTQISPWENLGSQPWRIYTLSPRPPSRKSFGRFWSSFRNNNRTTHAVQLVGAGPPPARRLSLWRWLVSVNNPRLVPLHLRIYRLTLRCAHVALPLSLSLSRS